MSAAIGLSIAWALADNCCFRFLCWSQPPSESSMNRTPGAQNDNGRDHNAKGFSMWMAGGGVKGGRTIGATDELGLRAVKDRLHVHDLHATILHLLGLDHERLTYFHGGRDHRLTDVSGRVVEEVLG